MELKRLENEEEVKNEETKEVKQEMNIKFNEFIKKESYTYSESECVHNDYFKDQFRYDEVEENFDNQIFFEQQCIGE